MWYSRAGICASGREGGEGADLDFATCLGDAVRKRNVNPFAAAG